MLSKIPVSIISLPNRGPNLYMNQIHQLQLTTGQLLIPTGKHNEKQIRERDLVLFFNC